MKNLARIPVPPNATDAARRAAESMADIVGRNLCSTMVEHPDLADRLKTGLSPGFLLELGAIAQIGVWDRLGLTPSLDPSLPSPGEAAQSAVDRTLAAPCRRLSVQDTVLIRRITSLLLNRFCWDAKVEANADLVIGESDEDAMVEAIAMICWQNRHIKA